MTQEDSRPPRHRYVCPVRWGDVDAAGQVSQTAYLRFMEEARIALFRDIGFTDASVLASLNIVYLAPLQPDRHPVVLETSVTRIGRASFDLQHDILGDRRHASAECVVVAFDTERQRSRGLTPTDRDALSRYAE